MGMLTIEDVLWNDVACLYSNDWVCFTFPCLIRVVRMNVIACLRGDKGL